MIAADLIINIDGGDGPQGHLKGTKPFFGPLISITGSNPRRRTLMGSLRYCSLLKESQDSHHMERTSRSEFRWLVLSKSTVACLVYFAENRRSA